MNSYEVGSAPTLSAQFTDGLGIPANPDTVTAQVVKPSGDVENFVEADMSNPETGQWDLIFDVDDVGQYSYVFSGVSGSDTVQASAVFAAVPARSPIAGVTVSDWE